MENAEHHSSAESLGELCPDISVFRYFRVFRVLMY
jgi:hypothetical protein